MSADAGAQFNIHDAKTNLSRIIERWSTARRSSSAARALPGRKPTVIAIRVTTVEELAGEDPHPTRSGE